MIIEAILSAIYKVLNVLLVLNIPDFPSEVSYFINQAADYLAMGAGILANYTYMGIAIALLTIIIAVDIGIGIYHFVMWIIRKIPMLGMS